MNLSLKRISQKDIARLVCGNLEKSKLLNEKVSPNLGKMVFAEVGIPFVTKNRIPSPHPKTEKIS